MSILTGLSSWLRLLEILIQERGQNNMRLLVILCMVCMGREAGDTVKVVGVVDSSVRFVPFVLAWWNSNTVFQNSEKRHFKDADHIVGIQNQHNKKYLW